jgi:hypothetical protein
MCVLFPKEKRERKRKKHEGRTRRISIYSKQGELFVIGQKQAEKRL